MRPGAPDILFSDCTKRDVDQLPALAHGGYSAGFPCQSFSGLGKRKGLGDFNKVAPLSFGLDRKLVVFVFLFAVVVLPLSPAPLPRRQVLKVMRRKRPLFALLENVAGITQWLEELKALFHQELEGQYHVVVAAW